MARDGNCWMSGANGLWRCKDPKDAAGEVEMASLAGLNVIALAEDRKGGVWAGTRERQVWRLRRGEWVAQTNCAQSHAVTAILHENDGTTWIGTEGDGLYRYQEKSRAHFEKGAGLLSDWVRALYWDAQGTLWIGTAGGGLSRWLNGQLTTFTTREGLPDNTISQILEDGKGRLWLGSNRGIACVGKRELEELVAGKIAVVYPQVYGRAEGMPSEECTGGFYPAGLKTQSGQLCFSTLKGIVVVDPRLRTAEAPAPAVVLEETLVDGVAADVRPPQAAGEEASGGTNSATPAGQIGIRIGPGKHRLEFRYTGMSFSSPERVRFHYRLGPLDTDWVEAGARRAAFYSYVPPGQYRFRVIACNSSGIWNDAGASLSLVVAPHLWQAWWFIGLASLGLLAAVAGTVRVAEKKKHQRRRYSCNPRPR
jgi:hypothetical protein